MQLFNKVFSNSKVILPVIHVEDIDQVLRNAAIAYEQGCDGVFLISHGSSSYVDLMGVQRALYQEFSNWLIGVNCLDLAPVEVFGKVSQEVSGIWVDNAMIEEKFEDQIEADIIKETREKSGWQGLYFGGVAFKYQRAVYDLAKAARIAMDYVDVITTSGQATGKPAYLRKIIEMKQGIGDKPLAIASGITPQNIDDYLKVADCFLVATGISKNFWELDVSLVKELVCRIRNYQSRFKREYGSS